MNSIQNSDNYKIYCLIEQCIIITNNTIVIKQCNIYARRLLLSNNITRATPYYMKYIDIFKRLFVHGIVSLMVFIRPSVCLSVCLSRISKTKFQFNQSEPTKKQCHWIEYSCTIIGLLQLKAPRGPHQDGQSRR